MKRWFSSNLPRKKTGHRSPFAWEAVSTACALPASFPARTENPRAPMRGLQGLFALPVNGGGCCCHTCLSIEYFSTCGVFSNVLYPFLADQANLHSSLPCTSRIPHARFLFTSYYLQCYTARQLEGFVMWLGDAISTEPTRMTDRTPHYLFGNVTFKNCSDMLSKLMQEKPVLCAPKVGWEAGSTDSKEKAFKWLWVFRTKINELSDTVILVSRQVQMPLLHESFTGRSVFV